MPFPTSLRILARAALLALSLLHGASLADEGTPFVGDREYVAKATFLRNCAHFIGWPESAFESPEAPLTICVFGDDPFGPLLDRETAGATIHGRKVQILRTRNIDEAKEAQLLFVSQSEMARLSQILAAVRSQDVVTVGETDAFLAAGGMIALKAERGVVRLRINTTTVQSANVTVSSKLLRIATQR